jgi:HD-GYP domain-containing protein (c-di-GMP phosphodiesterase class II)
VSATAPEEPSVRLAELIAALSLATDLGSGLPLEQALRSCALATRFAAYIGLGERECGEVYFVGLLRSLGCVASAREVAAMVYNEITFNGEMYPVDKARPREVLPVMLRHAGAGQPPFRRAQVLAGALRNGPRGYERATAADCEVAQRLAGRLGMEPSVVAALGQVFERWDGKGAPTHARGEAIALAARIVQIATVADLYHREGGDAAAQAGLRARAGSLYDPGLVERFAAAVPQLFGGLDEEAIWEAVLAAEPGSPWMVQGDALDRATRAIADFADLKSPYFVGHSPGVAALAEAAGRAAGLPVAECVAVRRASHLHDIGRVGVPNGIWNKPGKLTASEWERVRLHPYYTDRVLARARAFDPIRTLASCHHERADGSGYYRGLPAGALPLGARILAAADVYHALIEPRPHRPALAPAMAADVLCAEGAAGRLDQGAVTAVLGAAGHDVATRQRGSRELPAGLTAREVEVLRLIARGQSNRQMARSLVIAEKTVSAHVQHIYDKLNVSTRAGATLFAAQHDLLEDLAPVPSVVSQQK